jgi:putative transposase
MVELPARREAAEWIRARWSEISERRAAKLANIPRTTLRRRCKGRAGEAMRALVRQAAMDHPRYGHRRIAEALRKRLQRAVSRRNVQRIMQEEELQVRTRRRRKWVARTAVAQQTAQRPDERWAMDFVTDWCVGVRRQLRILALVDCCTREALAMKSGYSMPARRVVEVLESLRLEGRKPEEIRVDNGPEFVSGRLVAWRQLHGVRVSYFERGKPHQNGHAESFNGRMRDECLNGHYFLDREDAQRKLDTWRMEYLHERPHSSLGGKTPVEVAESMGVKTPFASPIVHRAKTCGRQGDPSGSLRSALTAARLGQKKLIARQRA